MNRILMKLVVFLVVTTFVLTLCLNATMAQERPLMSDPPDHVVACIRNLNTGEITHLSVHRELVYSTNTPTGRQVKIKYAVEVPTALLWSGCARESNTDPSISYRLTLTQYYDEFHVGPNDEQWYVSVDRYTGEWESLDPQVTGTDGYLRAGVAGRVWGGGVLYRTEDSPHFTPGDWATDTLYPSWAGTYVEVNAYGSYQCGQISVELLREPTGYKWEFWFNICKGSVPW